MALRKRTSVVVLNEEQILAFKAIDPYDGREFLFLPGGLIETGESAQEAAIRETLEETGYSIKLRLEVPEIVENYNFLWNGKIHKCQTTYFRGDLISKNPQVVVDASYNKGVVWVPLEEAKKAFSYHPQILGPVCELTKK